jgi:hypothetical protein
MELILAILGAGPIGYLAASPRLGLCLYLAVWALVLPVQTYVVFQDAPAGDWWQYVLVNAAILALGLALNTAGSRLRDRRRPRRTHDPRASGRAALALALTAVAGAAGAGLLASAGDAAAGGPEILRVFQKTRSLQLTKADGTVDERLPLGEPEPGDVLDGVFALFPGNHVKHGKRAIGSVHLRCEFVADGPPECVSHAALGSSMLVVEGNPGKIVLGTGRYLGATGRVLSAKEVKGAPPTQLRHNDIDAVVRINRR